MLKRSLFPKLTFAVCLLSLAAFQAFAQQTVKRPINAQDFDSWKSLQERQYRATANSSPM